MNQNNQNIVYVAVKPDQMGLINNYNQPMTQYSPRDEESFITHKLKDINGNTAPTLFILSIINLAFQFLQIKFLAAQLTNDQSDLGKHTISVVFIGFLIKLAFSLITILASAFYDHKSLFSTFRGLSIALFIGSVGVAVTTLVLSYTWLFQYQGLDYIYLWYLVFISIGEIILYVPFGIYLFSSK
mmetsp:Transcript_25113/g.27872  ORF Transcript_25113/g.27872 Transcript_25113/m.27872 type:complete len:185 (-) Transcript_25113:19-573(-)